MSSNSSKHPSKTPTTTIKIAAKEASRRNSAGADPGPGDPSAAPSEAPQLIDLPDPPTPSELVVKSTSSKKSIGAGSTNQSGTVSNEQKPSSGYVSAMGSTKSKTKSKIEGSVAGPAASNPSVGGGGSAREPTSSRPLTGPTDGVSGHHSTSKSHHSVTAGGSTGIPKSGTGSQVSAGGGASARIASPSSASKQGSGHDSQNNTASTAMQADSGAVHDEDEEGEGEVEQPASPATSGAIASGGPVGGLRGTSQPEAPSVAAGGPGGSSQLSTSAKKSELSSPASSPASPMASSGKKSTTKKTGAGSSLVPSGMESSSGAPTSKDNKKVTKFRYHKRITVRTSGKTSPSAIMDKVNKKDHNAGITPSTIEDMDPQELMRRAGIKGTNKTHWRVRLRQTKRLTKNGKTVTQTKVAYRDSEGNKRVKTSSSPFCKNCGKKLEECKCETSSQNSQNQ